MPRESSSGQVSEWGNSPSFFPGSFTRPGQFWIPPTFLGFPSGTSWPIINRAYATRFFFARPTTITAVGINVTVAGTASNVVRLGIYTDNNDSPGIVVDQTTVAGDATGAKTWTLSTPLAFSGMFWVAACPQGTSSPGSTWMSNNLYFLPLGNNGSTMDLAQYNPGVPYWATSTTFADNPSITWDQNQRNPVIHLRLE